MSDAPSLCDQCIKGVRHEGEPRGKIEIIGGVETYIAIPEGEYDKTKAVLFLMDAFGLALANNKLLADDFAANGFQVYMPDYFEGDPVPVEALTSEPAYDFYKWFTGHMPDKVKPIVDNVVSALKERGITAFASMGFCFGAPFVLALAKEHVTSVSILSHPSLLQVPEDIEKYRDIATAPLLINSCEVDGQFPPEKQKITDELLGDGKFKPGYKRTYWDGCEHGFAVRGDMSNPKVKAGKEGAFKASVEWLKAHF